LTLWQAFAAAAEQVPAKPAIVFYDSVLSYAALRTQAEALAGWLQQRAGLAAGERVLLLSQNCPQIVAAYAGIQRADAVVVPANAMSTAADIAHLLADSGARVAIVAQELLPRVLPALADGRLAQVLLLRYADALTAPSQVAVPASVTDDPPPVDLPPALAGRVQRWTDALGEALSPAPHHAALQDLCVLPYTSGTTGRPKGCRHSHATVRAAVESSIAWRGLHREDVFLAVAPLFHMLGMQNGMNLPLSLGATVVMLPRWDREAALSLIERHRVTVWGAPPPMLVDFFANPRVAEADIGSLRALFGGGAAMPDAVAALLRERYGLRYQEGYGMTETASFLHGNPPQRVKAGTLGLPAFGVETLIVDPDTLAPLPAGETGELVTRGPQVMLGYWRKIGRAHV
jgi:fatty-acyl-CoA synthase